MTTTLRPRDAARPTATDAIQLFNLRVPEEALAASCHFERSGT
jgi:hypothetical protein